jgi:nitrogen fixation NifU-like protein
MMDTGNSTNSATGEAEFRYSAVLIDHARNPRNMNDVPEHNGFAINDVYCGDMMIKWINVEDGIIKKGAFHTDGCVPSIACGSMATEMAKSKTIDEAQDITPYKITRALGGLLADHEHCASLAAGTLQLALTDYMYLSQAG